MDTIEKIKSYVEKNRPPREAVMRYEPSYQDLRTLVLDNDGANTIALALEYGRVAKYAAKKGRQAAQKGCLPLQFALKLICEQKP